MKTFFSFFLIMVSFALSAQVGVNDEYILTTIKLKDKSDKVIALKSLQVFNPDKTVAAAGKTDANGDFKTKLKRGVTYSVFFVESGQDWYFDVPISTDATAAYFSTTCKILTDQGQSAVVPAGTKNCEVKVALKGKDNVPLAGQLISLFKASGEKIGDYTSNAAGEVVVMLKQGLIVSLKTKSGGNDYGSTLTVPLADKTIFEISLGAAATQNTNDPNAGKCKVNFIVTDDIGVAEGTAVIKLKLNGTVLYTGETDIEGKCNTYVEQHKTYDVVVEKFGKSFNLKLELPLDSKLSEFDCMVRIKVVEDYIRTYTLENVYFDTDKWDLKPASYPALDQLYNSLKSDPNMKVELAGHTDSDGDDSHNMVLSQRRADAVKKYLTDKGIASNRVLAKGYGEKMPLVENTTDANKAKNRRTEVRVITE